MRGVLTQFLIALATITPAVLIASVSSATEPQETMTPAEICEDSVQRLVADDYEAFFSLEPGFSLSVLHTCGLALEDEPENPVFLVGSARAIDLGRQFYRASAERAVELLRKAAAQDYEPALVQLLRYHRPGESYHEDAFVNRIASVGFKLKDDLTPYVDALAESPSARVQDLVLGTIVMDFMHKRYELARSLAERGVQRNSAKAIYHYGMMHIGGMGIEREIPKGFEFLRQSARMGYLEAQVQFAFLKDGVYLGRERDEDDDFYVDLYKYLAVAATRKHRMATSVLSLLITKLIRETESVEGSERAFGLTLLEIIACNIDPDTRLRLSFDYSTLHLLDVETALPECRTEAFRSAQ
jgi:hypothetical protein